LKFANKKSVLTINWFAEVSGMMVELYIFIRKPIVLQKYKSLIQLG